MLSSKYGNTSEMSCKFVIYLDFLVLYSNIMELAHLWDVAISQFKGKVKSNYGIDPDELP